MIFSSHSATRRLGRLFAPFSRSCYTLYAMPFLGISRVPLYHSHGKAMA